MNNISITNSYKETFEILKKRIYESQYKAYTAVNKELIDLYWDIGKMIVEKQEKEKWGDSIVEQIAKDLQVEFPGIKGFSSRNIFRIRSFYLIYKNSEVVPPLAAQLTWTNNYLILEKCKNEQEREFYIRMAINKGWSKRTLAEMINNQEYERWAIQQNNFENTLPVDLATKGELLLRDHYNLDFLLLEKDHKERQLEESIVRNIIKFLAEMGGNFAFIGKQYPIRINENEFFVDLLFYHRKLKCLVAIELKVDEFKTEYASKMALYLAALDKNEKDTIETPSIGIIICRDKDRDLVDLTLSFITKPVGVATYATYKSKEKLPSEISKYMPTAEEIKKRLLFISD